MSVHLTRYPSVETSYYLSSLKSTNLVRFSYIFFLSLFSIFILLCLFGIAGFPEDGGRAGVGRGPYLGGGAGVLAMDVLKQAAKTIY